MNAGGEPNGAQRRRAWRSPRAWAIFLGVFSVGLATDLWLKRWSFQNVAARPVEYHRSNGAPDLMIPPHEPVQVVPRVLNLHLVKNDGAVFGIGANQRMFFIVFTIAALAGAVAVFARWTDDRSPLAHVALGLIMGGGFGNLYDRLQLGFVRDFLHMLPGWKLPFGLRWPGGSDEVFPWVFNAADVMLLAGMATLMWHMNAVDRRRKAERADAATGSAQPAA